MEVELSLVLPVGFLRARRAQVELPQMQRIIFLRAQQAAPNRSAVNAVGRRSALTESLRNRVANVVDLQSASMASTSRSAAIANQRLFASI